METIGSKIKSLRKEKEMTQEDLARKANIPYATLMKIENDTVENPTVNTMRKLAEALATTVDELITLKTKYDK